MLWYFSAYNILPNSVELHAEPEVCHHVRQFPLTLAVSSLVGHYSSRRKRSCWWCLSTGRDPCQRFFNCHIKTRSCLTFIRGHITPHYIPVPLRRTCGNAGDPAWTYYWVDIGNSSVCVCRCRLQVAPAMPHTTSTLLLNCKKLTYRLVVVYAFEGHTDYSSPPLIRLESLTQVQPDCDGGL